MRAAVIDGWGGRDRMRVAAVPVPQPGPRQLLVRMAFASVNPADWKCREGWLSSRIAPAFPYVLGFDGAGVVAAIGAEVTGFAEGDRVVVVADIGAGAWGTFAEYVIVEADLAVALPDIVRLEDAAALPIGGMTAWRAVADVAALSHGGRVLVHGGAGGVGGYAIQLAVDAGALVAATCSTPNVGYVASLGASRAVDRLTENVAEEVLRWAPGGVDVVIDTVGQGTLEDVTTIVRPGGTIAAIGTLIADEPRPDPLGLRELGISYVVTMSTRDTQPTALRALVSLAGSGRLHPPRLTVFDLAAVGEAFELVESGHNTGKVLLRIGDER